MQCTHHSRSIVMVEEEVLMLWQWIKEPIMQLARICHRDTEQQSKSTPSINFELQVEQQLHIFPMKKTTKYAK